MEISKGWLVALGALGLGALWKSRRPGEMNEERDRLYRECLSGGVPLERMKSLAQAFEKARCFPQAKMLYKRIALEELPPEVRESREKIFYRALASSNGPAILRVAQAFDDQGATRSALRLRRHAAQLNPIISQPVVTPPPTPPAPAPVVEVNLAAQANPSELTNVGQSNGHPNAKADHVVAVPEAPAVVN
jgi:hypothetical protein